jgi:hypothetical protein
MATRCRRHHIRATTKSSSGCSRRGPTSTRRADSSRRQCAAGGINWGPRPDCPAAAQGGGRRQRAGRTVRQCAAGGISWGPRHRPLEQRYGGRLVHGLPEAVLDIALLWTPADVACSHSPRASEPDHAPCTFKPPGDGDHFFHRLLNVVFTDELVLTTSQNNSTGFQII